MKPRAMRPMQSRLALILGALLAVILGAGCAGYGERVAPVPLPESQPDHVAVDGVRLVARPFVEAASAREAFGFDVRGAGLLPVRFVVDNQSDKPVQVRPEQTFLIDEQGQAWPLLTAERAYGRVKGHVELTETAKGAGKPALLMGAAGALAGMAVGVLTGENVGEAAGKGAAVGGATGAIFGGAARNRELAGQIREDLAQESLRNSRVGPGELAHGYLFFPGKGEAGSARELRLGLRIGEDAQVVRFPFSGGG